MAMRFKLMFMPTDSAIFFTNTCSHVSFSSLIPNTDVFYCSATPQTLVSSSNPNTNFRTVAFCRPSLRSDTASHKNEVQIRPFRRKQQSGDIDINEIEEVESVFDESVFTRVFDIAALRVPSEHCISLENHLHSHLLNWPRISNIAMSTSRNTEEVQSMNSSVCSKGGDDDRFLALNSRGQKESESNGSSQSSNPELYIDKVARTSDFHRFGVFKNSEKMSNGKGETEKDEVVRVKKKRPYKNDSFLVEVVEDREVEDMDGLRGLLGNEFKENMLSVSTRLLLLEERYGTQGMDDMPEIIKVLLKEKRKNKWRATYQIVRCKLTLFYSYWRMNEILEAGLPLGMVIPRSFKTVGQIAYLNLREEHLPYKEFIAKVVLDKNKPKIQTVVTKTDTRDYPCQPFPVEVLAGNRSLVTTIFENGLRFHIDMKTVYWNYSLARERQRLVSRFRSEDIVCDVFAGVGQIALLAANKVKRVYANDSYHYAVEYLERNKLLNKLEFKTEVYSMDGRRFIETVFANQNSNSITQVVVNSPNEGLTLLGAFRGIYGKQECRLIKLPRIHIYSFSKSKNPESDLHQRIKTALGGCTDGSMGDVEIVRVWSVTPRKWILCASFDLPKSVAMASEE